MSLSIESYLELFRFRGDTFALQQGDGSYLRYKRRPTKRDLEKHLTHKVTMGLYPSQNNQCFTGCLDYDLPKSDAKNVEAHKELQKKVLAGYEMLDDMGVTSLIEATGGRGYHIWVFSEQVPTSMMHDFLERISEATMGDAEIFPIPDIDNGVGKTIRIPLGKHKVYGGISYFVDPSTFEKIELTDEMALEISNKRVNRQFFERQGLKEIQQQHNKSNYSYDSIPKAENFQEVLNNIRPCFRKVYENRIETSNGQGFWFMTAIAAEIMANGGTEQTVHDYFSVQDQYNPKETNKNLRPIIKKGLRPFKCSKLQDIAPDFVLEYCADCPIQKQYTISEKLDQVVDKTQDKRERLEGDIKDTMKQFEPFTAEIEDLFTGNNYSVITNGFNSGKTWATICFMKDKVQQGQRVNFIAPSRQVKVDVMERMRQAEVNFIDNPSNMDLCPRSSSFEKIGYIPTMVCKKCSMYYPIQKLIKPLMDDYIENADKPFHADVEYFNEKAKEYGTCGKWVYLATLEATREENMVMLMTHVKVNHHLFIPNSPLIPALVSGLLFCNVLDQVDFINGRIPKITFSEQEVQANLKLLGINNIDELSEIQAELEDSIELDQLDVSKLDNMQAIDKISSWLYVNKMFDNGILRRISHKNTPGVYDYDFMGDRELKFVLNGYLGKKYNPKLYDATIEYIKNLKVDSFDGVARVPKTFKTIIEEVSECDKILGITSTPAELDLGNLKYHDYGKIVINQAYSIRNNIEVKNKSDVIRTSIFSRKMEGEDYINDGLTRGYTGTGGDKHEVVIEGIQYPKYSDMVKADLIQLNNGDIAKGEEMFNRAIINDGLTQVHKYNIDGGVIYVPNTELFCDLGYKVQEDDTTLNEILKIKFEGKEFLYEKHLEDISEDRLNKMISAGLLKIDGKKYYYTKGL